MAKSQKKSNRETRKPKRDKPKAADPSKSLFVTDRPMGATKGGNKK